MKKPLDEYSDNEIIEIASGAKSFHNFIELLGYKSAGGNDYNFFRNYFLKERKLSLKFRGTSNQTDKAFIRKYTNEELFVKDCAVSRKVIKSRILSEKLLPYVCDSCKISGFWNGKELALQLEHKNGVNNDNRLENLCFLCPNCHTQTDTFASRNITYRRLCECGSKKYKDADICTKCAAKKRITEKPPIEDLIQDIKKIGYTKTGEKYGVSDNAIRKWVKGYGLDPKTIKK